MKSVMMGSLGAALLLSGCGGGGSTSRSLETAPPTLAGSVSDYPAKLGEPYVLEGITYTPVDVFNYDEAGYASWYGKELNGRDTANGEMFLPDAISGAHRTLPLPSYVEVTALDTGKTILVRLNDRGPSSANRLIDLSYGAAKQLGMLEKGSFPVRVRRVNPPEAERAMLRAGQSVAMRMDTPESLLVPLRRKLDGQPRPANAAVAPNASVATAAPAAQKPAKGADGTKAPKPVAAKPAGSTAQPAPTASSPTSQGDGRFIVEGAGGRPTMAQNSTGDNRATLDTPRAPTASTSQTPAASSQATASATYFVQVAAFSTKARADDLAKRIGAKTQESSDGKLFRVRYGPYVDAKAAEQGLTLAKRNGYQGARILQDSGR
ncbi:septal ring lytic transglycosylase RlpA family protein [Blastomonas sp.]|uniref:septal ring lytic transglycosylase RlpA family protein n=1 Tax=Blastomonas sp. TaxID=1909299 RepID=UPI00261C1FA8|nr:septal ring lytic transglycosylase RlpA family protein [Blastomonas sp.]MDM7957182.1 septal ring lytic transglycosylase RlpA family protein [Blastomonas sp.]